MKFQHKPYKNFHIKEIVELKQESFTKLFLSVEESFVFWCDGVLLHFNEFENKANDSTKTFETLHFSKCTKFVEVLSYEGIKLQIIDVSESQFHKNLVEWLKHTDFWRIENAD